MSRRFRGETTHLTTFPNRTLREVDLAVVIVRRGAGPEQCLWSFNFEPQCFMQTVFCLDRQSNYSLLLVSILRWWKPVTRKFMTYNVFVTCIAIQHRGYVQIRGWF